MKRIYSNIDSSKLILTILRFNDISKYRADLSPESEYLQVSGRKLEKGIKVAAHKHLPILRNTDITQEAWAILEGCIEGKFYDLDNSLLYSTKIKKGDIVVLYRGGHSLEVLSEDTIFYEFKTGPYFGYEADKENIE